MTRATTSGILADAARLIRGKGTPLEQQASGLDETWERGVLAVDPGLRVGTSQRRTSRQSDEQTAKP